MASKKSNSDTVTSLDNVAQKIFVLRGERIILDVDLADLYGVETKVLLQSVKRNLERFPDDFMFQLTKQEFNDLRSQFVTSRWGGRRYPPYAFTEHGVAMLSGILRSPQAISVNIEIIRVFVQLRQIFFSSHEMVSRLDELDQHISQHDESIAQIIEALRQLMTSPEHESKRSIGFAPWQED